MGFWTKTCGFDLLVEVICRLRGWFVFVKFVQPFSDLLSSRGRFGPGQGFEEFLLVFKKLGGTLADQVEEEYVGWAFLLTDAPEAEGVGNDEFVGQFHRTK